MSDSIHINFKQSLLKLESITLAEMDTIKLMNRVDTKYLTDESHLKDILGDAAKVGYRILEIEGERISLYDSVYYDTDALKMFRDHHNRRLVRQKVRTREYVNSGDAFLEIKKKNNKGRTNKKRIPIPQEEMMDFHRNQEACGFLANKSWFHVDEIRPVLETSFSRMTLVNSSKTERLTIDINLYFHNYRTEYSSNLQDAVIIELKQDGRADSLMKRILLDHRVKPMRLSKYCIAVTLTDPNARSGRFKRKVRAIEKTINKKIVVE